MAGNEGTLLLVQDKALAAAGTPAEENPTTRFYPTGIQRSRLLAWLGVAAAVVLLAVLLWTFFVGA